MYVDLDFNAIMSITIPIAIFIAFVCCACYGIHRKKKRPKKTKVTPANNDFI